MNMCLSLLTLALPLHASQDTPLDKITRSEKGCIIIEAQGGLRDPPPLSEALNRYLAVRLPDGTNLIEKYGWAPLPVIVGFSIAREGHELIGNASIKNKSVRIIIIPNASMNAMTAPRTDHLDIFITTGLIDVVDASARGVLADMSARIDAGAERARDGFSTWIDAIRSLSGRSVVQPSVPFPAHDFSPSTVLRDALHAQLRAQGVNPEEIVRQGDQYQLSAILSASAYAFVFGHELSHLIVGPSDGGIGVEEKCDSLSFRACAQTKKFDPNITICSLVALREYDGVFRAFLPKALKSGDGAQLLAGEDWNVRAHNLLKAWKANEGSVPQGVMYIRGWKAEAERLDALVARAMPMPAVLAALQDDSAKFITLQFDEDGTKWHTTADNPSVDYRYTVTNTHPTSSIEAAVDIISGYGPRDGIRKDFHEHQKATHNLVLAPGETKELHGTLRWWRDAATMPGLDEKVAHAKFLNSPGVVEAGAALDPRSAAIARVAKAAENDLNELRSKKRDASAKYEHWSITEKLPGAAAGTLVIPLGEGRRRVVFEVPLSNGLPISEARTLLGEWTTLAGTALPQWTPEQSHEKDEDGERWTWEARSPNSSAKCHLELASATDDGSITLRMIFWEAKKESKQ